MGDLTPAFIEPSPRRRRAVGGVCGTCGADQARIAFRGAPPRGSFVFREDFRQQSRSVQILEDLHRRNIAFQSIMDGIDTNTAAGRMVFSMVSAMAEFERSVISERTKAGVAAARRRGRHVGRPAKLALDQLDYAWRMIVAGKAGRKSPGPSGSIPRTKTDDQQRSPVAIS
jgi:hypothetical protein